MKLSPARHTRAVLALILIVASVFCSCSPGGDPALIGKWRAKDGSETIEFRSDGKCVDGSKDSDITGMTWAWEDTNHIRFTATSKLVGKASGVMKIILNGDTLTLKDEDGPKEYTRVK